jgi:glycosyltransferase involved in cell wall biosynthesis
MRDDVTPLILTYNEEANIGRTLERLSWAREIVVLDSGSDDGTRDIAGKFPAVHVVVRPFDNHAAQWNYGLREAGIRSEWVLALDADYIMNEDLLREIDRLDPALAIAGYRTRFRYCIFGKPLSRSMYPPVVTLYRRRQAHYVQDGHTQRVIVDGAIQDLRAVIDHDDRKSLNHWLSAQLRYAELECALLSTKNWAELRMQDRIRKLIVVAPWMVPLYCLTFGMGLKDGWPGLYYALQRGTAETILSMKLLEALMTGHTKRFSSRAGRGK